MKTAKNHLLTCIQNNHTKHNTIPHTKFIFELKEVTTMIVKNSINAINEFTQLTNDLLAQGYHILEVQSDPNKQQNQAIVLSKNIVPKKGQDIVVVFRITRMELKEPFSRTILIDNIVGYVETTKVCDWASYWDKIYFPPYREVTFHEHLEIKR